MEFEYLNDISFDVNIFYYIIASIFLIIFNKYFFAEWVKKKQSKKRIDMWIDFLRSNESIDRCLTEYEEIGSQNRYIILPIIIGAVLGILFVLIFLFIILSNKWNIGYLTFINFIPYLFILLIMFYVNRIFKEKEKIIASSHLIYSIFSFFYCFIIFSNSLILMNYNMFINLPNNTDLYLVSYFTLVLSIIASIITKKSSTEQIKIAINNKYSNSFPNLQITTKDKEIRGQIRDIFNENLIILDGDDGFKSVVEWDSISSLKLQETKILQSHINQY